MSKINYEDTKATYLTSFCSISIVEFEQLIVRWVGILWNTEQKNYTFKPVLRCETYQLRH